MNKFFLIAIFLLAICAASISADSLVVNQTTPACATSTSGIYYDTIQNATNNAIADDTVIVCNDGIYYENVNVPNAINLRGNDSNAQTQIIAPRIPAPVMGLNEPYTNVSNFNLSGSAGAGLSVVSHDIAYNIISQDNQNGFEIHFAEFANVTNCSAIGNGQWDPAAFGAGFKLYYSNFSHFDDNYAYGNLHTGFFLDQSNTNFFDNNWIEMNGDKTNYGTGIYIANGQNNYLFNNTALDNANVEFHIDGANQNYLILNNASSSVGLTFAGFFIANSALNELDNNTATITAGRGFLLSNASQSLLQYNLASTSYQAGFDLNGGSNENTLRYCDSLGNAGNGFTIRELSNFNTLLNCNAIGNGAWSGMGYGSGLSVQSLAHDNNFTLNYFENNPYPCIDSQLGDHNYFTYNSFLNCSQGILLNNSVSNYIANNSFSDQNLTSPVSAYNIKLINSNFSTVYKNTIEGNNITTTINDTGFQASYTGRANLVGNWNYRIWFADGVDFTQLDENSNQTKIAFANGIDNYSLCLLNALESGNFYSETIYFDNAAYANCTEAADDMVTHGRFTAYGINYEEPDVWIANGATASYTDNFNASTWISAGVNPQFFEYYSNPINYTFDGIYVVGAAIGNGSAPMQETHTITLSNNTIAGVSGEGIYLDDVRELTVYGNIIYYAGFDAINAGSIYNIYQSNFDSNEIRYAGANNPYGPGSAMTLKGDNIHLYNNLLAENMFGIFAKITNADVQNNTVHDSQLSGMLFYEGSNKTIYNNTLYNNNLANGMLYPIPASGMLLMNEDDAITTWNTFYNNTGADLSAAMVNNSLFEYNDFYNATSCLWAGGSINSTYNLNHFDTCGTGIHEKLLGIPGAKENYNNTYSNNRIEFSTAMGFFSEDFNSSHFTSNIVNSNKVGAGAAQAEDSTISGNTFSNNGYGLEFTNSTNTTVSSNTFFSNNLAGFYIIGNWTGSGNTYYENGVDLKLNTLFGAMQRTISYSFSNDIFKQTAGSTQNYSNVSITDVATPGEMYTLNYSVTAGGYPTNFSEFLYWINITNNNVTSTPSIDSLSFSWTATQAANVTEANIRLMEYNGTNYTMLSYSPNLASRMITTTNVQNFSLFGMLIGPTIPVVITPTGSSGNSGNAGSATITPTPTPAAGPTLTVTAEFPWWIILLVIMLIILAIVILK